MSKIALTVFSILLAVAYGVAFSQTYPDVAVTGGLATLFAVLGIATVLVAFGVFKLLVWAASRKTGRRAAPRRRRRRA